jgi:hypothetical protein
VQELKEQVSSQDTQIVELKGSFWVLPSRSVANLSLSQPIPESRSALYKAIKRIQDEKDYRRAEEAVDLETRASLHRQLADSACLRTERAKLITL